MINIFNEMKIKREIQELYNERYKLYDELLNQIKTNPLIGENKVNKKFLIKKYNYKVSLLDNKIQYKKKLLK